MPLYYQVAAPASAANDVSIGDDSPLSLPVGSVKGEDAPVETPRTRYARSADGTYIAYQVFGDGFSAEHAKTWCRTSTDRPRSR